MRQYRFYLLIILSFMLFDLHAQEDNLRIGLQVSPVIAWMSTNDSRIEGAGGNFGFRFGISAEKYFRENYAIVGAFSMVLNEGGTLKYELGGNYLPNSDLSDPSWNAGQKPLSDGTEINYHVSLVEATVGLKLKTNDLGGFRVYSEFPRIGLGLVTGVNGDIVAAGINAEKERIGKDFNNFLISWGGGAGVEFDLGKDLILTTGLFFQQTITDVTKDDGRIALELTDDMGTPDPTDDVYETQRENSKGRLGSLTIRAGIMF